MVDSKKTKITISVDEELFQQFKNECQRQGMKVSPRINVLIRNSLKNKVITEFIDH